MGAVVICLENPLIASFLAAVWDGGRRLAENPHRVMRVGRSIHPQEDVMADQRRPSVVPDRAGSELHLDVPERLVLYDARQHHSSRQEICVSALAPLSAVVALRGEVRMRGDQGDDYKPMPGTEDVRAWAVET